MVSVSVRPGQSPSADQSVCEVGVGCTLQHDSKHYSQIKGENLLVSLMSVSQDSKLMPANLV